MNYEVTPGGIELLRSALAGQATINFRFIQLGNGPSAGTSPTHLSNVMMTVGINSITREDLFVALATAFDNGNVQTAFQITEWGIIADDPEDSSAQILFAYCHVDAGREDYMPAAEDYTKEFDLTHRIYVGEAESVTATISESTIWATKAALDAHVADQDNPHGVTREQLGLGNVQNVSTNDQTPTYTEASALTTLTSGERLAVAFGKIKKAISSLIAHINSTGNVHGATAAQIGAAAASHTHGAGDINTGIISILRGGTGAGSAATALANLGGVPQARTVNGKALSGNIIALGAKSATIVVGTSAAGWTINDCDYLCDGTDDQVEINQALAALPAGGGAVLLLNGTYNISGDITISKDNTELRGMGGTVINSSTAGESWVIAYRIKVTANKCAVRNLVLVGPQSSSSTGLADYTALIQAVDSDRSVVDGNRIVRGTIYLVTCTNTIVKGNTVGENNGYAHGIQVDGGSGHLILANNLTGAYIGVGVGRASHFLIQGNVSTLFQEYGIAISNDSRDFTISGNSLHTNRGGTSVGITVGWARNYTVQGNSVSVVDCDADSDCIQVGGHNFVVTGNFVKSNTVATPIKVFSNNSSNGLISLNGLTCKNAPTMGVFINATAINCTAINNLIQAFDDAYD